MAEIKSPFHLLLVDDDADDRMFFCDALHEVDPSVSCVAVSSGSAGIIYLNDETNRLPDYIFLDLRMPGMSGRAFLALLKDDPRLLHIPVIVYTTSNDEMDSEELIKMGAKHFTTKPANPDEIYYILSMILNENW